MKKLNNKGLSVVEFIVVFVMLMILVFGMMDVIINLKNSNTTTTIEKELLEYKTTLTKVISDDLIKRKFKNLKNVDTSNTTISAVFKFADDSESTFSIDYNNFIITYNNKTNPIPKSEYLEMDGVITIKTSDDNKFLLINIPYFEIDKDVNYGINIVHPIGLK